MNSARLGLVVVAGFALMGLMAGTACLAAAAPSNEQARLDRFDGLWDVADSMLFNMAPIGASEDPETPTPPLKGEYLRLFEENAARLNAVKNAPPPTSVPTGAADPRRDICGRTLRSSGLAPPMPSMMTGSQGGVMEVISAKGRLYFYNTGLKAQRRIYVDGRSHPTGEDLIPNPTGHSIGHWEGDVLVVDTTGFVEGRIDGQACHSDAFHIVERMRFRDPDTFEVVITLTDPKALAAPWSSTRVYKRRHEKEIVEPVDSSWPTSNRSF